MNEKQRYDADVAAFHREHPVNWDETLRRVQCNYESFLIETQQLDKLKELKKGENYE